MFCGIKNKFYYLRHSIVMLKPSVMKYTYSLLRAKLVLTCLLVIPVFFSHRLVGQTQCSLGTLTLNVVNLAPDILGDPQICQGGSTLLHLSQNYDGYLWSTGASSSSITVTTAETYTVTVSNAAGCTATDAFTVAFSPVPVVAITGNLTFCSGGNTLLTATAGFSSYSWTGGSTGSSLTVTAAGTYSVTVTGATGCTGSTSVVVTSVTATPPTISGSLQFCQGDTTILTANGAGFNSYLWSSGQNTQSINVSSSGNYTVTATTAIGCTGTATATVQSNALPTTSITGNTSICPGGSTTLTATGAYPSILWSNGMTGPSITVGQGNYSVTVSTAQACTGTAAATVTTSTPPTVEIAPLIGVICESAAAFNLSATPSGGVWGGDVGAGGSVDPATLGPGNWTATYAYTDANGCSGSDQLDFEIVAEPTPSITAAGPFCPAEGAQTLTATPVGGTWGGAANALGEINPSALGTGNFIVTYTASTSGNCASNTQITITVSAAPTATISGAGNICEGSGQAVPIAIAASGNGPFDVIYTINGATPTTVSVPVGTTNLNASTAGTYEIVSITDAVGCVGNGNGQAVVNTVSSPIASTVTVTCDALQTNYQVMFGITDGDPASYSVTSAIAGTLSSGPPYIFTSDWMASGSNYQFVLDDANGCSPTVLSGSFNCNCGTNAGDMDATPLVLCAGETATAMPLGNAQLQPNDVLLYYLHDGSGNSLGTVFGTSSTPSFNFAPPLVAGQTYYISAVAGDGNGTGGIDLNDPCLSVSVGTPVTWQAAPSGSLSAGASICEGEATTLVFTLSGTAPFEVTYSNGAQNLVLQNILDGHSITVSPATTTTYTLTSVEDSSPAGCSSSPGSSVTVVVNAPDMTAIHETSCVPAEVGVFTNVYTNQHGCDSTVVLTVTYQSFDETFVDETTCDPAMAGVFTETFTNQNGCDSVVTTTVTLIPPSLTELTATTCDPAMAGVFTETFTNQNGCDSVVTTTVTLLPSDLTELTATTCDPAMAGVFTENFTNQNGCDSVVTTTVTLLASSLTELTATTCDPMQTGVFTNTFTNQNGCDSVVVTTVSLLSPNECNVSFQLAAAVISCGSNEGSISIEVELGQFPLAYNYSGTGGSGSGSVTSSPFSLPPLPAGQYSVTLTNANGLSATETVKIVQATAPMVTIELLNGLPCSGEPLAVLSANVSGAFPPYDLLWSNGATTPTISNLGVGNYEVSITGDYGCEATAAMAVNELSSFEIEFTVSNPDCFENSHGSVTVNVTGGQSPYQFSLNNGVLQAGNSFDDLTDGAYQIAVEDANGCKRTASFAINAPLLPDVTLGDDMLIEAGDGATLNAIVNLPDSLIASIVWTGLAPEPECPTCLVQPTVPLLTSTYSITVESVDGCTDSDDITVYVKKNRHVYVPSAFSPDGDGINDVFFPFAKNNTVEKINTFYVFSRWGESVFSATDFQPNDPTHGWDGKHRGQLLDAAVFVWYAEIEFKDGEVVLFEGDVTLMR